MSGFSCYIKSEVIYLKKLTIFYYDHFAEFETVMTLLLLKNSCEISTVALEKRPYQGEEMQWFCNEFTLQDVEPSTIDLLLIPGGDPQDLFHNEKLKIFIEKVVEGGGKVAGICGGSELLAALGLLDGRKCTGNTSGVFESDSAYPYYNKTLLVNDQHVVVDGPYITGQGQAYAEFAVEVARQMGSVKDDLDFEETLKWLKNIRS